MYVISGRNVNSVYAQAVDLVRAKGVLQPSRAGDVLAVPEPVVLETLHPQERVLLDPVRDANPYFHFFEALWMLAGRNDAAFLNQFVRDFGSRFAELDGHLHGAYGYRWRDHFGIDQLDTVVKMIRDDPTTRRVVISMWDPEEDLLDPAEIDAEKGTPYDVPKDIPCNTQIFSRMVQLWPVPEHDHQDGSSLHTGRMNHKLDLMVVCRSNDVIWGATGANAVHFAFLQEYLAGRIGCQVGTLRQMTTNLHGYTSVLAKVGEPSLLDPYDDLHDRLGASIGQYTISPAPIGNDWAHWDEDLYRFLDWIDSGISLPSATFPGLVAYNIWFQEVAKPMYLSHHFWKLKNADKAMYWAQLVQAPDWSLAAQQWLQRRIDKKSKVEEVRVR